MTLLSRQAQRYHLRLMTEPAVEYSQLIVSMPIFVELLMEPVRVIGVAKGLGRRQVRVAEEPGAVMLPPAAGATRARTRYLPMMIRIIQMKWAAAVVIALRAPLAVPEVESSIFMPVR